jgi:malonyl-CoA O-methyltransferase
MPDTNSIAAAFHRQAAEYDRTVLVQRRVVDCLAHSLEPLCKPVPQQILDVGCGTGSLLTRLHSLYPQAALTGVDLAFNMCRHCADKLGDVCDVVQGDAGQLAFKNGSFDLVVSSSVLQWVTDLSAVLRELRRVVMPQGRVCLAFFCDGTLHELQSCYRDAVNTLTSQNIEQKSRLHSFHTVEDVLSILSGMDFEQFVVTSEVETDWYDDLTSLLRSIKNIGAGTVSGGSGSGLGWRGILNETYRLYRCRYGVDGRIPASYTVLYLTAKAP